MLLKRTYFNLALKGSVKVGQEQSLPHEAFHTLVLSSAGNETGVSLTATEDDTEFILVAGEPLDQTVFQYGPFVMTNREEIMKTLLDCKLDRQTSDKLILTSL